MIKRLIIATILLVLVCGGLVGFNIFRSRAIENYFATAPKPTSTVSTQEVKPVTWTPNIAAIGTVNAARGVDLTVQVTGVVTDIRFKANQKVKKSDILLQLDDEVERADLEASRAQASLDKVAQTRAQELQRRGVGSEQALDAASAAATTSTAKPRQAASRAGPEAAQSAFQWYDRHRPRRSWAVSVARYDGGDASGPRHDACRLHRAGTGSRTAEDRPAGPAQPPTRPIGAIRARSPASIPRSIRPRGWSRCAPK